MPTSQIIARLAIAFGLATSGMLSAKAATSGQPYDVQVILPITGSAGFLGAGEKASMDLEQGVINAGNGIGGRPVHFVYHDDQSSPQLAVQIINQLMSSDPRIIIGSALVSLCNAMGPRVRSGPVLYCLSPGIHPDKGNYVFTSNVSTQDLFRAILRYYRERGWTQIALLTSTDASGQDAERGIKEELEKPENKGFQLVAAARFNPSDVSADAQIQRMKAANPQAIITWTSGTPLGTVFRAISSAGWDVPVAISNSNMLYVQMAQYAGFTPKQLYIGSSDWLPTSVAADVPADVRSQQQKMQEAFKAAGQKPDNATGLTWDTMLIAVAALDKVGPAGTNEQVRDYIDHLKGFAGINGIYDFEAISQRGIGLSGTVVTQWVPADGTWKVVSHPGGAPLPGQ